MVTTFLQAIRYFEKLLHDLDIICALSLDPVLENVLHFIAQFQQSVPDLVPRAFLQVGHTCMLQGPSYHSNVEKQTYLSLAPCTINKVSPG